MATFAVKDLVIVNPLYARSWDRGVVYRVTRILPINIEVEPIGGGRKLRANPDLFQHAPTGTTPAGNIPAGAATVTTVPLLAPLWPASVVTVAGPGWRQPAEQLWVVLRDKGDTVSIAKLGADAGRYFPKVPRTFLTVIDPAHLTYTPPTA
jgi:hypothetical protein